MKELNHKLLQEYLKERSALQAKGIIGRFTLLIKFRIRV
jgi:hypothetical protein